MTGIVGGERTGTKLTELLDSLYAKPEYETSILEDRNAGLALTEHGDRDPNANWVWQDDRHIAIVHGVISNSTDLPWSTAEIFPKLFDQTVDVLPRLEGPFLLACCDTKTGEFRVATDKVGSRPCYYTTRGGFHFASELSGLLPVVDPTIDTHAVSDLLLMGTVVGENTLLEEVRNLPPASMISYSDGELSVQRYWYPEPQFDGGTETSRIRSGTDPYVKEWVDRHQRAVNQLTTTLDSDLGLWLSGGIDSRSTAAALKEATQPFPTLSDQTVDGSDQTVAQQVASELGVRSRQIRNESPSEATRRSVSPSRGADRCRTPSKRLQPAPRPWSTAGTSTNARSGVSSRTPRYLFFQPTPRASRSHFWRVWPGATP
jgi:asparagine synthase (glutamine-hydrolysing)